MSFFTLFTCCSGFKAVVSRRPHVDHFGAWRVGVEEVVAEHDLVQSAVELSGDVEAVPRREHQVGSHEGA